MANRSSTVDLRRCSCRLSLRTRQPRRDARRLRHRRHHLLRQHIQRIAQVARRLHLALVHRLRHSGACNKIRAVLGKDHAFARRAHVVPRAPDALHPTRHDRRRLDLDHQIDRAHVDAQFQRRRAHQRAYPARLQHLLNLRALRRRERAMMRARHRLACKLIDRTCQPLRHPPVVHKNQRRRPLAHNLQQPRMDRTPDRSCASAPAMPRRSAAPPFRPASPCPPPAPRCAAPAASARPHSRSSPAGSAPPALRVPPRLGRLITLSRLPSRARVQSRLVRRLCLAGALRSAAPSAPARKRATSSSGRCVAREADALERPSQ